jgi:hypothetical protein
MAEVFEKDFVSLKKEVALKSRDFDSSTESKTDDFLK